MACCCWRRSTVLSTLGGCAWQLGCVNSSAMVHSKTLLPSKINYKSAGNCFFPLSGFISSGLSPSFKFSPPFHHFINFMGRLAVHTLSQTLSIAQVLRSFVALLFSCCSLLSPLYRTGIPDLFEPRRLPHNRRNPLPPTTTALNSRAILFRTEVPSPSPESMQNPGPEAPR
jgi:hypothetical protein